MTGRLARLRALSRAALWWEGAWVALWPVLGLLGGFVLVALLGLPARLPAWGHLALLLLFAGGLFWLLRRARGGLLAPDAARADRRLEMNSGLAHRPLAALADRPATADDPAGAALWAAHRKRMEARITRLRVGLPRPGLARRDPRALRAALLLGVFVALVVAGRDAPALLARAAWPAFPGAPPAVLPRLEAWVTPPAYTGAPPVFLPAGGGAATVPAGSRLQVAISGAAAPSGLDFSPLGAGSHAAEAVLDHGQHVSIRENGRELAAWDFAVQADAPPVVRFPEPPGRAQRGLGLRLPWQGEDDWGLSGLRAEFRLAARPDAPPILLEASLPSASPRQARGLLQPELTSHPWAGLEVVVRLVATDGAGQQGQSEEARLALPERAFNHPVARAMIELRKALSRAPADRVPVLRGLESLAGAPDAFEHDVATQLALRLARAQLRLDRRPEAVAEVQELLWEAALALEEGRDGRTARALAEAQQAMREALAEAERNPEAAREAEQRAELERRAEQLREAIRRHMEALAERLQQENAEALPYDPQQRMLDGRDMERRTRRMEQAAREGRMDDARRELAELEEMLRALQEGRVARSEPAERQGQRQRGQQQMNAVQDMVRRQGEMLDQATRRTEADEQRRAQTRRNQPAPAPDAAAEQQRRDEARRQRALRRALGELMQQHGDLTGEVPEALGRADQAMREAQEALGQGGDPRAAQGEAMRRLQEGGRQMAQQMQRQFGRGQGQGEGEGEGEPEDGVAGGQGDGPDGEREQAEGRDPLGRRSRDSAGQAENGSDTRVPEEGELLRTRRLQEELRRRGAERERARDELDYIDRLLRRF